VDSAIDGCTLAIRNGSVNLTVAYATRCVAHWLKGASTRAAADCHAAHAEKGEHQAALVDYTRSLELKPTPTAHYNRGTTRAMLGEYALALADFDQAISGRPSVPQAHLNRALALYASGRIESLTENLDRAVGLLHGDPRAAAIRRHVLDAVSQDGKTDPAKTSALAFFPPSRVLPTTISLEALPTQTLPITASQPTQPLTPLTKKLVLARTPPIKPGPRRDSLGDCVLLWSPETQMTQQVWKETCRRLDFSTGARRR